MNFKKWKVSRPNKDRAKALAETLGIPPFLALLLDVRGVTTEEGVRAFLERDEEAAFDPMQFADMAPAVERITRALEDGEHIAVFGDYDADGVTATVLLCSYLESVGGFVSYYIPDRESEGYGMNCEAIAKLAADGVTLIVTVDNGVSAIEEIDYAKSLGVDVVVTDHHRPREQLPNAVAVVDPHRKDCPSVFKELAGVGVAFQLVAALEGVDGHDENLLENYADLVAIGTVGDVVSLTGENRALVQSGLRYLAHTDRPGLQSLMEQSLGSGGNLTATDIAFGIVPRLNATGRMGSAESAVSLLLCEDPEEAHHLAEEVCRSNDSRKSVENDILEKTEQLLRDEPERLNERVLVVEGEGWHHGVIGIVASRLLDRYGKPTIVISLGEDEAKGSGRSVEGFSLFDAIHSNAPLFTKYGGHPMAAGFSMKREYVTAFRKAVNDYAAMQPTIPAQTIHLDCKLRPAALSVDIPHQMQLLEPFGTDNPLPLFGLFQVTLTAAEPVGGGKHLRLLIEKDGATVPCILFGTPPEQFPYHPGDVLDLAVQLSAKEFRGKEQLSVIVREIRISGLDDEALIADYDAFEQYKRGESLSGETTARLLPCREELVAVYQLLRSFGNWRGHLASLLKALQARGCETMNLAKLLVSLQAMRQRKLIACRIGGDVVQIAVLPVTGKVDIFSAPIFTEIERLGRGGSLNVE